MPSGCLCLKKPRAKGVNHGSVLQMLGDWFGWQQGLGADVWTANVEILPAGGDFWGWTARRGFLDRVELGLGRWRRRVEREGSWVSSLGVTVTLVPGQSD